MKKSIKIATLGLASLGLAGAMPASNSVATTGDPVTYGENAYTDTIDVTIAKACTFSRGTEMVGNNNDGASTGAHHIDGDGSPSAVGTWVNDKVSGTLAAGAIDTNFGSSNFVVACNNYDGWKVTATAGPLTGLTHNEEAIPLGTPATDTAAWNYTSSTTDTDIKGTGTFSTASQVVATSSVTTPTAGRSFKVQYAVSVNHTLSAQTYEGTIVYTFAQL